MLNRIATTTKYLLTLVLIVAATLFVYALISDPTIGEKSTAPRRKNGELTC